MRTPNRRWQSGFIRRKASIARCVAEMAMATLLSRHGHDAPAGIVSYRHILTKTLGVVSCFVQTGGKG